MDQSEIEMVAPTESQSARGPLFRFDHGWLLVIAGIALGAAAVLIPAADDLAEAEYRRDQARATEQFRSQRLVNYTEYLDAVERRDSTVIQALAATQLHLMPASKDVLLAELSHDQDASVLAPLEPAYLSPPEPAPNRSMLHSLVTDRTTRLWIIASSAMMVLLGLLPPAPKSDRSIGSLVASLFKKRSRLNVAHDDPSGSRATNPGGEFAAVQA